MEDFKDIYFYIFYIHSNSNVQVKKHYNSNKHNLCSVFLLDIKQDRFNKQKIEAIGGEVKWYRNAKTVERR